MCGINGNWLRVTSLKFTVPSEVKTSFHLHEDPENPKQSNVSANVEENQANVVGDKSEN